MFSGQSVMVSQKVYVKNVFQQVLSHVVTLSSRKFGFLEGNYALKFFKVR